mgnify:CR=1 FL=1|jgi:hypothetical protein
MDIPPTALGLDIDYRYWERRVIESLGVPWNFFFGDRVAKVASFGAPGGFGSAPVPAPPGPPLDYHVDV